MWLVKLFKIKIKFFMELTQIKWEKIWEKTQLVDGLNKIKADDSLMKDSKLAHFAEIEREEWWDVKISALHDDNHLKVNWRKIPSSQSKKISEWDTVSFWENRDNIFAVHTSDEKISKENVKMHIEKSWHQLSDEEFSDILKKLKLEEKLIRWLFIWLLTVSVFLTWIIFALNSQNWTVSKKIYESLNSKDQQIQELQDLIWENPNDELECDPEVDDSCEIEWLDLFSQIAKLEEKNKELVEKIADTWSQKILEEKISALEGKIFAREESWEKINFDEETKLELSKIISSVVEEINSFKNEDDSEVEKFDNSENQEKISQLEEKISDLQNNISWEELDFWENWEKVGQAVKILLGKIMELQKDVNNLK